MMNHQHLKKNPYIVGSTIQDAEMFFGRADVFNFIREHLPGRTQNNPLVLEGQTRVGKTSVLMQMEREMRDTHVPVFVDLQALDHSDLDSLLREVMHCINRTFVRQGIPFHAPNFRLEDGNLPDYFRQDYLSAAINAVANKHLLLMFDEFPLLFRVGFEQEVDKILPYVNHLAQFFPQLDYVITVGSAPKPEWEAKFARFLGNALRKKISFLERADAVSLITKPVADCITYSEGAIDEILRLSGRHPYYVQLVCHCLFNQCQERCQGKGHCNITTAEVKESIDRVLEAGGMNLEDMWGRLTEAEQTYLAILAAAMEQRGARSLSHEALQAGGRSFGWEIYDPSLLAAAEGLVERDVIAPAEPCHFQIDLLRHWLVQQDKIALLRRRANFATIKQQYLEYVKTTFGWLDFRGILQVQQSMFQPLLDVFVPLRVISEKWSDAIIEDFMRRERARRILQELEGVGAADGELRQALQEELRILAPLSQADRPKTPFKALLKDAPAIVMLGDPGSGKTTLLRYLSLIYAEGREQVLKQLGVDEERLPVFVALGAYANALRDKPDLELETFIVEYSFKNDPGLPPRLSWLLTDKLAAGHAILLFDGLDEASNKEERRRITENVLSLAHRYPANRYIVTSRILGYTEAPLGQEFAHCTLVGFETPDVKQFVQQWCRAYERQQGTSATIDARAEIEANKLFDAIQDNSNVQQLAENPLLLTIIALIHRKGAKLPGHRIELYALCVKTLIETWRETHIQQPEADLQLNVGGSLPLDEKEAVKLLAPLALWMHEEKPTGTVAREELEAKLCDLLVKRSIPSAEAQDAARHFLHNIERRTYLLVQRGQGSYSFSHRTFQEYFAARAIAMNREEQVYKLRLHRHDPRWREVILLTIGQFGIIQTEEETATKLVQAFFDEPAPYDEILHRDLLLAGQCLADDVGVSYPLQKKILKDLLSEWHTTPFEQLKQQIVETLAAMRLAAIERDVVDALIEHLALSDERIRAMSAEALGSMGRVSSKVIQALLRVLEDPRERVRASAAQAIGRIGNVMPEVADQLARVLQHDLDLAVRRSAAEALVRLGKESPEALQLLLSALHFQADPDVRGSAAAALTHLKTADEQVIEALLRALGDSRTDVRSNIAKVLGTLGRSSEQVVSALQRLLQDPNPEARIYAALALSELEVTDSAVIQSLVRALGDTEYIVRRNAVKVLGRLGKLSLGVVSQLSKALASPDKRVRTGAANALGQAGHAGEEVLNRVYLQMEQSEEWQDRLSTVEAVVSIDVRGDTGLQVTKNLLQILTPDLRLMGWDALSIVATLLGEMAKRNSQVMASLLKVLSPEHPRLVRVCAAEAIGIAGQTNQQVLDALVESLHDPMDFVRGNAAQALGRLGKLDEKIAVELLKLLGDPFPGVQLSAVEALGKLGHQSNETLKALLSMLDDDAYSVYHTKYLRDGAFETLQVLAPYGRNE